MNAALAIYETIIREHHLDTFGHVNNATYLELLEEARWEWLTSMGYGFKKIHELKQGPTILEINIQYLKELKLRQKIRIETRVVSYEKKIGELEQKILNESNELCCLTKMKYGLFDMKTRKLISPTPEWLTALGISS